MNYDKWVGKTTEMEPHTTTYLTQILPQAGTPASHLSPDPGA